jgi:hypothetical protein
MTMLLLVIALILSQLAPQQAYVLDHPIDPNLLIIATQYGRYPFALLAGTDCSWVHSDMNITITNADSQVWQVTDSGTAICNIVVQDRVDATPCFTDDTGVCDINGEHP